MVYQIFRPLSNTEKAEITELGHTNVLDVFLAQLAEKRQEYGKKFQPYDAYTARIEFEEYVRRTVGDVRTIVGKNKQQKQIVIPDLEKYGDVKRFQYLGSKDVFEDKLLDGIRNSVRTGKEYQYKGKEKGNGVTIFVPMLEVENVDNWVKEAFKEK